MLPLRLPTQRSVYLWSRRLVSYTALEVMLIATPLISIAFGPISAILLDPGSEPCYALNPIYNDPTSADFFLCLRIDAVTQAGWYCNVAVVLLGLLTFYDGAPTAKYLHRKLFPHDPHPPPSAIECCAAYASASSTLISGLRSYVLVACAVRSTPCGRTLLCEDEGASEPRENKSSRASTIQSASARALPPGKQGATTAGPRVHGAIFRSRYKRPAA